MKLILTGASGFIGKNFLRFAPKDICIHAICNSSTDIEKFVEKNNLKNVKLHRCDFTKKEEIRELTKKIGDEIDYCVYLAGNVNVPLSVDNPIEDLNKNVVALINFTSSFRKIKKFVYMSSAAVYDGNTGWVDVNKKLNPKVPYCISKLACEHYVNYFIHKGIILNYTIIRFGGAYGPYSKTSKLIHKILDEIYIKDKKTIDVYGDGKNKINIMYSKDVVKALIACIKNEKSNVTANLGQNNMTIKECIDRIAQIFGKKIEINYTPRLKTQKFIHYDYDSDFNKIFNFKPGYAFESGIKEFGLFLKNKGE